ncbi:MAG TPA: N-acetylneuraminate synthase family protein [Stellaceae bacterium]|nr:N-acetylneuraminate synthase family protein [Stellaceae bacterium]
MTFPTSSPGPDGRAEPFPFLIAEIGSVHDGSYGNAVKLIETAARCGADAVKFQTHIAEAETLTDAPAPAYFTGEPRFAYFKRTAFSREQWAGLKAACASAGVTFLSSPFSIEAVDLLEAIGAGAYKIPSGEVTNLPLLERVAATGKPALLSSGMSSWAELDAAVAVLRRGGPLMVMQCSSAYPCPPERVGLNVIGEMRIRYGVPVGFSDHSTGPAAALAAVALGARTVEKHLTFSRLMYGSDAANAMEPADFAALARQLDEVRRMLAHPVDKDDLEPYGEMKRVFEKSIVASRPLAAGAVLAAGDLAFKKPGDGIPVSEHRAVIGRRLRRAVPRDHKFSEADFA